MWQETHLIIGEHPEGVYVCFYGKARAGCVTARHNTSNKCAMAQSILQCWLMRPIGSLSAEDRAINEICMAPNAVCPQRGDAPFKGLFMSILDN